MLRSHPARWAWETVWVIGIAVARYVRKDELLVRNLAGPVVEVLVGKRRQDAEDKDTAKDVLRGACDETNKRGYWAIPTAYVEPDHPNAEKTLVLKLWDDLGLVIQNVVGCCSDEVLEPSADGRRIRKITHVVTTQSNGGKEPPEKSEYSKLDWLQLEHLRTIHQDKMEGKERQAVQEAIRFAEMYRLESRIH